MKKTTFAIVLLVFSLGFYSSTSVSQETNTTNYWSDSSERGSIPDKPMAGKINAKETEVPYVEIKFSERTKEWQWKFANKKAIPPCATLSKEDAVRFRSKHLKKGTFSKKMDQKEEFKYQGGYHYAKPMGGPMSVIEDWEGIVVINKVDKPNNKVMGWAQFKFKDGKTEIAGSYEAYLCKEFVPQLLN